MKQVESGQAPPLSNRETPFQTGYVSLVILGAQRLAGGPNINHEGTLEYLLRKGCPVDSEDITGLTALHHLCQRAFKPTLARILLENGANFNHRNRYGEVPIFSSMQTASSAGIDLLMEYNADLDIPDADGVTPRSFITNAGPVGVAIINKWLRKRTGGTALMEEKKCELCQKTDGSLKLCARCHLVRYCSRECQRSDWAKHKITCRAFSGPGSLTFNPVYKEGHRFYASPADITRAQLGISELPAQKGSNFTQRPSAFPKPITIKVQLPYTGTNQPPPLGEMLAYTKKRDFVCMLSRERNPAGYDGIREVIMTKGVAGLKAYFAAEIKSHDELVIKVDAVLAAQPF
ncbi:hypothetical protein QCA50_019169 [Cerrena zonata]|uniref:MYND-type domain-containing protein n=1 Tax=Cerrena zonata TaxID=2478898 RepID=A0AAW0FCU8_9APHY